MSAALAIEPIRTTETRNPPSSSYNFSIGYLRAFITLLVLAHHAVLAYHPFAPPAPTSLVAIPRWWSAFPVVDPQRSMVFALFAGFNDMFFMALMFFLSGLFVWPSLQRKGVGHFLRDRALRLGIPFIVAAALVAPLAYYPAYLQSGAKDGFWHEWPSLGNWPAGPAWFVWVLLAFDVIAAVLLLAMPKWGDRVARIASAADRRPGRFFLMLLTLSALAYVPLELIVQFIPLERIRAVHLPDQPDTQLSSLLLARRRRRRARAEWRTTGAVRKIGTTLAAVVDRCAAGIRRRDRNRHRRNHRSPRSPLVGGCQRPHLCLVLRGLELRLSGCVCEICEFEGKNL